MMLRPLAALVLSAALTLPAMPLLAASAKAPAPATATAAAAPPAAPAAATAAKQPSPAQLAARERMKTCGAEWRDMKAKGTSKDMTWREFSKGCLSKKG